MVEGGGSMKSIQCWAIYFREIVSVLGNEAAHKTIRSLRRSSFSGGSEDAEEQFETPNV